MYCYVNVNKPGYRMKNFMEYDNEKFCTHLFQRRNGGCEYSIQIYVKHVYNCVCNHWNLKCINNDR